MISTRKRLMVGASVLIFSFLMFFLHACMPSFRMSSREIDAFFSSRNVTASQQKYSIAGREIHYVQTGNKANPLLLFVHGSPGSLSAFIDFLADTILLKHALLITADRPGFGHSNFGLAEPSLAKQAACLKPILEKYKNNKPRILVGHSLGGPLIAKMAIDYPELVDGLIIVAGSVDPALEPNETWFRAPLATPFLSWILPRSLRSSNEEIYQLKPELEQMLPYWKNITCPVIVIQGKKDELVPYENIHFAQRMLVNAPLELVVKEDMNHFVPWSNPELIREAALKMVRPVEAVGTTAH
jgi:pimeloyl-ACP methyl ester carboxylesterase